MLWALSAVAIPVIIHLFNLRRTRRMDFSTLMFLKEFQQTRYRKIKLKQLLILLCRIGFITFLVLTFAKPFHDGYLTTAGIKEPSSIFILLDDSYSMESPETSGSRLDIAKHNINGLLDLSEESDEIFFTTFSGIGEEILPRRRGEIRDTLQFINTSVVTRDLDEILYHLNMLLRYASNDKKEIFLITDAQKIPIRQTDFHRDYRNLTAARLNIILCGSKSPANISADTLDIKTRIFERNKHVKIAFSVHNRNNYDVFNKKIVLRSGNYTDEKVIDIPANSGNEVIFSFLPEYTGYVSGYVEITRDITADDEIASDNRRYFTFFNPDKVNLLLIGTAEDVKYINFTLDAVNLVTGSSDGSVSKFIQVSQSDLSGFKNEDLDKYDVVVIVNKPEFSSEESIKIKTFIENGGGVVVYPGNLVSADNYSNVFLSELNIRGNIIPFNSGEGLRFDISGFNHPMLEGIFRESVTALAESPVIRKGFAPPVSENSVSVIKLSDGRSFVREYTAGRGRLIFFAVSPDMKDSDYPEKNIFPALTIRSILYAANLNYVKPAVAGQDYFIDGHFTDMSDSVLLKGPVQNYSLSLKDNSILNLKRELTESSVYSLYSGNKNIYEFPVNHNSLESDDSRYSPDEFREVFTEIYKLDADIYVHGSDLISIVNESRAGRGLWMYSLIIALTFIGFEFILSMGFKNTGEKKNMAQNQ
jgi:hypothetical protein